MNQPTNAAGKKIIYVKRVFFTFLIGLLLWGVLRLPTNTLSGALALLTIDVALRGALVCAMVWVIFKVWKKTPPLFPTLKHALKRDWPWLMGLAVLLWLLNQH